jgi:hypothetical protein
MLTQQKNPIRCAADPQKWDLLDGQNGYLTEDNEYAAEICKNSCPFLQACLQRALAKQPRGVIQAGLVWNTRGKPYTVEKWNRNIKDRARNSRKKTPMPIEDLTPQQKYEHIYRMVRNLISSAEYLDPDARTFSLMSISERLETLSSELFSETETV